MVQKRLIRAIDRSPQYIAGSLLLQWCSLVANIVMMIFITNLLQAVYQKVISRQLIMETLSIVLLAVLIRFFCSLGVSRIGYVAATAVKKTFRRQIYQKLLQLGGAYGSKVQTAEIIQVAVEGVDQLEVYISSYLPQLFFSVLAPLTLFVVFSSVDLLAAVLLLICVPFIPITIAAIQTWAKKLLAKYWGQYTSLGDIFLESLQGLTTLKIYQADGYKSEEIAAESEKFRKMTMRVLAMQLNSITIMDVIAYGGSALGIVVAITRYANESISLSGCLLLILLSAEFFIPMRQLGSFFHIAMNGMAASDKMFRLLDLAVAECPENKKLIVSDQMQCHGVKFSYDGKHPILTDVDFGMTVGSLTAVVGESGSGKSTLAALLSGRHKGYSGSIQIGGVELSHLPADVVAANITYIGHDSYLFAGTVRENLLMGNQTANEEELWAVLVRVGLADVIGKMAGLDTQLTERAANLSGGQRQRLALARAVLHNSPIYIFDEATSNIDVESEHDILMEINLLAKKKTVLLISHRLLNVQNAEQIYVMAAGRIKEHGTHQQLLKQQYYARLWHQQQTLERYRQGGQVDEETK